SFRSLPVALPISGAVRRGRPRQPAVRCRLRHPPAWALGAGQTADAPGAGHPHPHPAARPALRHRGSRRAGHRPAGGCGGLRSRHRAGRRAAPGAGHARRRGAPGFRRLWHRHGDRQRPGLAQPGPRPTDSNGGQPARGTAPGRPRPARHPRQELTMSAELRVIDSDGHTMEPADLYDRYLDPRFRGRVTGQPAERRVDGQPIMNHPPDTIGALGFTPERIRERFGDIAPDGFTPAAVMRGQDVEGVDVSVIYGPLYDCFVEGMDPQLACAMARAYNRWMAEYAGESGGRIVGAAPIPLFDVKAALNEVEYAYHELGFRAFWTRPNPVGGRALGHADFEPLYALLESLDVPLSLHEGSGSMMRNIGSERYPDNWLEQHAVCHPMEQRMALMSLIVHCVL